MLKTAYLQTHTSYIFFFIYIYGHTDKIVLTHIKTFGKKKRINKRTTQQQFVIQTKKQHKNKDKGVLQVYLHFALKAPAHMNYNLVLSYAWLERVKTTTTGTN